MMGKQKYEVSPIEKHVENCIHETISVRGDNIVVETWGFYQTDFPCGGCNSHTDVLFMRCPPINNVVRTCSYCGTTEPIVPRHPISNVPIAELLDTKVVSIEEAREFLKRNGLWLKFTTAPLKSLLETKPRRERRTRVDKLKDIIVKKDD